MPSSQSYQSLSAASRARRDAWVDARLLDLFMRNAYFTLPQRAAVALTTAILLWHGVEQGVDLDWLLLWLALSLASIAAQHCVYRRYLRIHAALSDGRALAAFKRRVGWLWACSGLIWVLAFWMCYGKVSLSLQAAYLLVMVTFTAMLIDRLSAWPAVLHWYVGLVFGGAITVMLFHAVSAGRSDMSMTESFPVVIVGLCWLVLLMGGDRFHQVLQSTSRLQYRNQRLTRSLMRKTEAALRASALKNRLLAAASHDIRQPIHALSLYAQYLQDDPSQGGELAPRILQASRAINNLFDSLLSYAQIESGGLALRLVPVRVDELLRELETVHEAMARQKGLRLRLRLPRQPVVALSDPVQLRRIVGNLLDNAIKYTHQGGVLLALQVRRAPGGQARACVSVVDTGQGIAQQYQRDIFDEFVTVPSVARSSTTGGVGLGLAIVSRLAHALGHEVAMRSRLGKGTNLRVLLDDRATAQRQQARGDAPAALDQPG